MNAELTLEKAKTAIRQKEAVTVKNSTLKDDGDNKDASLDAFNRFPPRSGSGSGRGGGARGGRSSKPQMQSCTRCGYERHAPGARCPAIAHNCNRKGHYATFCYSKTQASNSKLNLDSSYLDTLTWIQSQTSHPLGTAPSKCKV